MKAKLHKRTVRQNRWGNWNGYEGGRRVAEFAFDSGVRGGVAHVAACSPGVSVTVIDFDNDNHQ